MDHSEPVEDVFRQPLEGIAPEVSSQVTGEEHPGRRTRDHNRCFIDTHGEPMAADADDALQNVRGRDGPAQLAGGGHEF